MYEPILYHAVHAHNGAERSKPTMPSPTLTNPDMLLPDIGPGLLTLPSPPRKLWPQAPPSPNSPRHGAVMGSHVRKASDGSTGSATAAAAKREKLGLMSRKMMLLRSRSESATQLAAHSMAGAANLTHDRSDALASSPTVPVTQDDRLLVPERLQDRRPSWDEAMDDMAGLPAFLAKYKRDSVATEEGFQTIDAEGKRYSVASTVDTGIEEHRRQQAEDEQASQILSKRAEQILADAKLRLNLMEGNLRGARDLVAPLTAANLKRATSLGATDSTYKGRYGGDGFRFDMSGDKPLRTLQPQASSPTIRRNYHAGHLRAFSELPERPHTAFDGTDSPTRAPNKTRVREPEQQPYLVPREASLSGLAPNPDDNDSLAFDLADHRDTSDDRETIGSYRAPSRTQDLRGQMSSLQVRISTLRDRAREDSLRRRSMQTVRDPTPLNNASEAAPELFYTSSPAYEKPQSTAIALIPGGDSPTTPERQQIRRGNAFAQQAALRTTKPVATQSASEHIRQSPVRHLWEPVTDHELVAPGAYGRDPDQPASVVAHEDREDAFDYKAFFLHSNMSRAAVGYYADDESVSSDGSALTARGPAPTGDEPDGAFPPLSPSAPETPERLREIERSLAHSRAQSTESISTLATFATASEGVFQQPILRVSRPASRPSLPDRWPFPPEPATTSTPTSTPTSTAVVGPSHTPPPRNYSRPTSRSASRPGSSPQTTTAATATNAAMPRALDTLAAKAALSDSSSERADSGVGLSSPRARNAGGRGTASASPLQKLQKPQHQQQQQQQPPPMSPSALLAQQRDPATQAVLALVGAAGPQPLGLKDKAVLFGVVEGLRKAVQVLQAEDGAVPEEMRRARKRLEEARRALDGGDCLGRDGMRV